MVGATRQPMYNSGMHMERCRKPKAINLPKSRGSRQTLRAEVSEITTINEHSRSFRFLEKEPDIYTIADLRKVYRTDYTG